MSWAVKQTNADGVLLGFDLYGWGCCNSMGLYHFCFEGPAHPTPTFAQPSERVTIMMADNGSFS